MPCLAADGCLYAVWCVRVQLKDAMSVAKYRCRDVPCSPALYQRPRPVPPRTITRLLVGPRPSAADVLIAPRIA